MTSAVIGVWPGGHCTGHRRGVRGRGWTNDTHIDDELRRRTDTNMEFTVLTQNRTDDAGGTEDG